jgi:hypothetical protein
MGDNIEIDLPGLEQLAGFFERGNELSGSTKHGEFFEYLRIC